MKLIYNRLSSCLELLCVLALFLFPAIHENFALGQEHDESLKQQFLREALVSWAEYIRLAEMVQGKMAFYDLEKPDAGAWSTLEYKTNGKCKLCIMQNKDCFGMNPRYAFQLQRTQAGTSWAVVKIIDLTKESLPDRWQSKYDDFRLEATGFVRLSGQPLSDIVQSPTFRVDRCSSTQKEGEEFVELSFTYDHEKGPFLRAGLMKGTLLLDPKHFWCLRSAEYTATHKNDTRFQSATSKYRLSELGATSGSFPVPKRYVDDKEFFPATGDKVKLNGRGEFNLDVPRRLPGDEEFTLSAFGLPEPPGLEWKRPIPWYLWLALAGLVCLALAVVLRTMMKRRTANS
jgi:hypothetical protein